MEKQTADHTNLSSRSDTVIADHIQLTEGAVTSNSDEVPLLLSLSLCFLLLFCLFCFIPLFLWVIFFLASLFVSFLSFYRVYFSFLSFFTPSVLYLLGWEKNEGCNHDHCLC